MGGMKGRKIGAERRERLLSRFERSGMSAAAFARKHSINYTTFCGWRQRARALECAAPQLLEVEVEPAKPCGIEVELGAGCRLRLEGPEQAGLAAALLRELGAGGC